MDRPAGAKFRLAFFLTSAQSGGEIPLRQRQRIDVHIAFDVIRLAVRSEYDVAGVFSQDQDLSEAGDEVRVASKLSGSWIGIACAYPIRPTIRNKGGINHSERIPIGRKT
jgi:hypothetical protein